MARALNSFGVHCRQIRGSAGKNMADQAAALSMSVVEISEIESGLRLPTVSYVENFGRWLRLTEEEQRHLISRIPTAKILQFPKASPTSNSIRLFRKVSTLSPAQIREMKSKE